MSETSGQVVGPSLLPVHAMGSDLPRDSLTVRHVSKAFAGNQALGDVSLEAVAGQIHLLIGPNGAGKSTLFNILTGVHAADQGEVFVGDTRIDRLSTLGISRQGISRTFQNLQLFESLTATENVMVGEGVQARRGRFHTFLRQGTEEAEREARARSVLEGLGIGRVASSMPGQLSFGQRRMLEIARALASRPRILLLDEPAAGLSLPEREDLAQLLRGLRDAGVVVLLVEHDMRFAMGLGDVVTVLAWGRCIFQGTPRDAQMSEAVRREYLG